MKWSTFLKSLGALFVTPAEIAIPENGYRKPSIDEFLEGFEFEVYVFCGKGNERNFWQKLRYKEKNLSRGFIERKLAINEIRVKK